MTLKTKIVKSAVFAAACAVLIFLDQWSKSWMQQKLLKDGPMVIIPKILGFYYVENTGAAFNLLDKQRVLFLIIASVAVVVCIYVFFKTLNKEAQEKKTSILIFHVFLCLIISGAIGNAIDRLINGYVVDFIRVLFINFPVFNIADCYVVVGCIFFLIFGLLRKETIDDIEGSLKRHG